jgi:hypothetical protein
MEALTLKHILLQIKGNQVQLKEVDDERLKTGRQGGVSRQRGRCKKDDNKRSADKCDSHLEKLNYKNI